MANDPYEVGYRKPPKVTQFAKGKSGNPKGRPKQSRNLVSLIDEELDKILVIQENGRKVHITKREALAKRMVNAALNGDAKSTSALISMDQTRKEQEPEAIELTAADAEQFERLQQRILDKASRSKASPTTKRSPKKDKPTPKESDHV
jgi:hypothetical protein